MSIKKTIGGDRLGSGKKMKVDLRTYERSTHDLSYIWRSTMASGTLIPFMSEVALPGDTFDINLNCDIMTHPTVGPLFGSYKVQLDVFQAPIRLYQGALHNNKLGIGMNMASVKLPQIVMQADNIDMEREPDNQHINPSCIFSYLNIRGLGRSDNPEMENPIRQFNAIPYLAYWDIYKNYYANKQEEIGAVIHTETKVIDQVVDSMELIGTRPSGGSATIEKKDDWTTEEIMPMASAELRIYYSGEDDAPDINQIFLSVKRGSPAQTYLVPVSSIWENFEINSDEDTYLRVYNVKVNWLHYSTIQYWDYQPLNEPVDSMPEIETFPLSNIDDMRDFILSKAGDTDPVLINSATPAPYGLALEGGAVVGGNKPYSKLYSQEGLGLKTYQSDLFNNWMSTEWIDGDNGISAITAIDTSDGNFTIDTLNLSKKVYDMLNRIAISGGSYDDWLDAVYTHDRLKMAESPIYHGGLIKELVFQEITSNAAAISDDGTEPLGTLAGKGTMSNKHKGGEITIRVDEPSYIIGIISLTPRPDYSQGNKWDVNLKTMDDFHKPALDEIGFQDLITDQMAWWDTAANEEETIFYSAGKQPAWINYMTNVNQVRGNFAINGNEMFMTLNRKYDMGENGRIKDLTTYIDPSKFNETFALKSIDAQNFWTQIGVNITARRKMSAKIMPNL